MMSWEYVGQGNIPAMQALWVSASSDIDLNQPQSGSMLSDERPQFSQLGGFP